MNKFVCIAALCLAVVLASRGVPSVQICSSPNALLQNVQYQIEPHDVEPGVDLKVKISGTLSQAVTSGAISISASFDGIPIYTKTLNLCHEITCPVAAGPFNYDINQEIPNLPISGTVTAQAVITAQDNLQVVCVDVTVSI